MSRKPSQRWLWIAVIILFIASSSQFTMAFLDQQSQKDKAQVAVVDERDQKDAVVDKASTLAQQVTTACAESKGKALRDLREAGLCKQAADTKATITRALDPSTPTPTTTGPSQAQVNAAVRLILAGIDTRGATGADGKRGPAPTLAQLAQAVVQYCATRDDCSGIQGAKGDTGDTGAKGDTGSPGSAGSNGANAPTIQTATCDADDHIVFGLSDGTSVVVAGSDCRVDLLPEPDPEP